ncbi:hypothetical protein T439DRAFT_382898 [Meredithblackwellia eburnea MCA 4105]
MDNAARLSFVLITTSSGKATVDFKNDESIRALTHALLKQDFNLDINLAHDRLTPIVPGRLEYLTWIINLALSTSPSTPKETPLKGIDIGTGSTAIYPLLASRLHLHSPHPRIKELQMVATEIDERSYELALENVEQNGEEGSVRVVKVPANGDPFAKLFVDDVLHGLADGETFDFTMCNPPFYSSESEMGDSATSKSMDPFAVCTGSENELITPGGEIEFVGRMVSESVGLGERIRWFSTLFGKLSSVSTTIDLLKSHGIHNYALSDLRSGQTKRWLLAWSLQDYRGPNDLIRNTNTRELAKLLPGSTGVTFFISHGPPYPPSLNTPTTTVFTSTPSSRIDRATRIILSLFVSFGSSVRYERLDDGPDCRDRKLGVGWEVRARENCWSRGARRRKKLEGDGDGMEVDKVEEREGDWEDILVVVVLLSLSSGDETGDEDGRDEEGIGGIKLQLDWRKGRSRDDFTGLAGFVGRKLREGLQLPEVA